MNFKQKEIFDSIITQLQETFPEVQLVDVQELNPYEYWVTLIEPADEERQFELDELQAESGMNALVYYGMNFHFVSASPG